MPKTSLQTHQSCSMQKTGGKNSEDSKTETLKKWKLPKMAQCKGHSPCKTLSLVQKIKLP